MTYSTKLGPCRACGQSAATHISLGSGESFQCGKCGHTTKTYILLSDAVIAWNCQQAAIVAAPSDGGRYFATSTKNTSLPQRDTLEEIICNLAPLVGANTVHRRESARGGVFYAVQAPRLGIYQSATNTILQLSREIASRAGAIDKQSNQQD